MKQWFLDGIGSSPQGFIWTAIISVVVSGVVSYFFRRLEIRRSAQIDYEYGQKKKLSELVGSHYGLLIGSSARFNNRMWNLYDHHEKEWTDVSASYEDSGYYFKSFVFRFMELISILREIEKAAIHLDTRIARREDFLLLNYVAALSWIMTDVDLFKATLDESREDLDHFYSDNLRKYCDVICSDGGMPAFEGFDRFVTDSSEILKVLEYFKNLKKDEPRERWDRLVCLHLLLMSFLDSFGTTRHKSSKAEFRKVAAQFTSTKARMSFAKRISSYDLDKDKGLKKLRLAIA
ncbi:hypothetical protein [Litoreibacter albidus]|uniref:hypothetical protein n=1 Tax=Litoreibacter albidus TaxID=670155 RepID=UPI003735A47B